MTLRKTAGLLAAFGLMVGLIGSGVGAVFTDQVTAEENINVGTFECLIVAPSDGVISGDGKSVSYTAPTIMSSAPGSAPFSFTVAATGSIPVVLEVSVSGATGPFSVIGAPFADVPLAYPGTHTYNSGVQWTELSSVHEGASLTVTWTIDCVEAPPPVTIVHTQSGIAGTGWYGWSCPAGSTIVSGSVDTALVVDGPAKPGSTVSGFTYPVFPHHTYTPPEEGWVVQNVGGPATQVLTIVCQP
jgi:predicted ribosomally synthesized peptide with SipW-like signal peptide